MNNQDTAKLDIAFGCAIVGLALAFVAGSIALYVWCVP